MNWIIRPATGDDIDSIITILKEAWYPAYGKILAASQSRYMLGTLFSPDTIRQQLLSGRHQFLLGLEAGRPIGFAAWQSDVERVGVCKLHKLYLLPKWQGRGYGSQLLANVVSRAREAGQHQLILNVNRANKAGAFYARLGFEIIDKVDIAIGAGYFMNDYVLSLQLTPSVRQNITRRNP